MQVEREKPVARIPINQNVELLVRKVTITEGEGDTATVMEAVELREFLKNAEVEGHGIFLPAGEAVLLTATALGKIWNRA